MKMGVLHGKMTCWNERGQICITADYRYGVIISLSEWDDEGNLIREQVEPTEDGKRRIEQHEAIEQRIGK